MNHNFYDVMGIMLLFMMVLIIKIKMIIIVIIMTMIIIIIVVNSPTLSYHSPGPGRDDRGRKVQGPAFGLFLWL